MPVKQSDKKEDHSIKAIIFDLGNVLVDFDHKKAARRLSGLVDKSADEIYDLFFNSPVVCRFEEGKVSPEDFYKEVKNILGFSISYGDFVPIWNEIFFLSGKNRSVYELTRILSRNYKLAMLSNVNVLHFEYLKKEFPVFDAFDHLFTSYEMGLTKPDPLIYQKSSAILDTPMSNIFYTDDRADLIEAASGLGIKGFVFEGIGKLKADLLSCGINME